MLHFVQMLQQAILTKRIASKKITKEDYAWTAAHYKTSETWH
jgi:hypothetical protein